MAMTLGRVRSYINQGIQGGSTTVFFSSSSTRTVAHQTAQFTKLIPAVQTFYQLYGHYAIPARFTVPTPIDSSHIHAPIIQSWPEDLHGMKLGTTVTRFVRQVGAQKTKRKRSLAHEKLSEQLQALGFPITDVPDHDWQRYLWREVTVAALHTYYSLHGNFLVPYAFIVPSGDPKWPNATQGYKLGYWATELRRKKNKLRAYQLHDLEKMRFAWSARETKWNEFFQPAMRRFTELYGLSSVPQSFVVPFNDDRWPQKLGGYRLGQKVNNLRCSERTGPLEEVEWQQVELIYKSWFLLDLLREKADSEHADGNEEDDEVDNEENKA